MDGDPCDGCDIEEKVYVCCARYPKTGGQVDLMLSGDRVVRACCCLDVNGRCMEYAARPEACRRFFCSHFRNGREGP